MYRLINAIRDLIRTLTARECPPDPLAQLSLRDFADLPVSHPRRDTGCPG